MCGFFGYLSPEPFRDRVNYENRFLEAQKILRHRGPDDKGIEYFNISSPEENSYSELVLGHTRLSIIDLSSGGHQPKHSSDGRFTIVFNGEIYNYRELRDELKSLGYKFHTDSDTEVLIAFWRQWGSKALSRLVGMFAFVIFDRADKSLTLVRDAFGIKPLFYQKDNKGFKFASEISAILCLMENAPDTNMQRAYDYLVTASYDDNQHSFYEGIQHLLPGHFLKINLNTMKSESSKLWWKPNIEERTDLTFNDAAEKLRELFLENVSFHLRSDVPVGAALSGGIDSSAVVCAMRYLEPDMPLHTFSYIAKDSEVDEESWVDLVNSHVKAIPHKIIINPNELSRDLEEMIAAQGEPFNSTSIYAHYRIFEEAKNAGIIVMLDGQGADELLAGYEGYPDSYLSSLIEKGRYIYALKYLYFWSKWPGRGFKRAFFKLGSTLLKNPNLIILARKMIGDDLSPAWLNSNYLKKNKVIKNFPNHKTSKIFKGRRLAERLRSVLMGNGLSSLLRHGDRNSMHWSIENRVPFLTTNIAEFLLQLPEEYLVSPYGETKYIFREAMRDLVPSAILKRKDKIGFQTPERNWLQGQILNVDNWLFENESLDFLNKSHCIKEIEKYLNSKKTHDYRIWRLINYIFWEKSKNISQKF